MNKVLLLSPSSTEPLLVAAKRYPAPGGEARAAVPDEAGDAEVVPVALTPLGAVAALVGSDIEFDDRAYQAARAGAELIVAPSADLVGREPHATHVARLRSVELGAAVLRHSTVGAEATGLSSAFDAAGRPAAAMDVGALAAQATERSDGAAMVAHLTLGGVDTGARRRGARASEVFVRVSTATLIVLLASAVLTRQTHAQVAASSDMDEVHEVHCSSSTSHPVAGTALGTRRGAASAKAGSAQHAHA